MHIVLLPNAAVEFIYELLVLVPFLLQFNPSLLYFRVKQFDSFHGFLIHFDVCHQVIAILVVQIQDVPVLLVVQPFDDLYFVPQSLDLTQLLRDVLAAGSHFQCDLLF